MRDAFDRRAVVRKSEVVSVKTTMARMASDPSRHIGTYTMRSDAENLSGRKNASFHFASTLTAPHRRLRSSNIFLLAGSLADRVSG